MGAYHPPIRTVVCHLHTPHTFTPTLCCSTPPAYLHAHGCVFGGGRVTDEVRGCVWRACVKAGFPPSHTPSTHTHTQHIFWSCEAWQTIRDSHTPDIEHLAQQFPGLEQTAHWPPCLLACGLAPDIPLPVTRQERNTSLEFLQAIHGMYVAILASRKIRDEQTPMMFPSARHVRQTGYPYQQLTGRVPRTEDLGTLTLAKPTARRWPWELPFLADLLSWTRQLVWADEPGTVTFIELALDFEETSQRTLPTAPQAKYRGTALPLAAARASPGSQAGVMHNAEIGYAGRPAPC